MATVGSYQLDFAILPAKLFHLLDRGISLQISLSTLLEFTMNLWS